MIPIWIEFPVIPYWWLYQDVFIRSIAGNIGRVLKIDPATANITNTTAARVCVEMDISKKIFNRIWIGLGEKGGWQPIVYPNMPAYCASCCRFGHSANTCRPLKSDAPKSSSPVDNSQHQGNQGKTQNSGAKKPNLNAASGNLEWVEVSRSRRPQNF